jgi:hypothetical protein
MEEIGDLSKTMMTNKYEDMIAKTPKKIIKVKQLFFCQVVLANMMARTMQLLQRMEYN